jgi:hypothetical protein
MGFGKKLESLGRKIVRFVYKQGLSNFVIFIYQIFLFILEVRRRIFGLTYGALGVRNMAYSIMDYGPGAQGDTREQRTTYTSLQATAARLSNIR